MCHTLRNNAMINNLHERRLRLIYSDKKSSYESLLEKDGLVSICHRNIHTLAMKMYKVKSGYRSKFSVICLIKEKYVTTILEDILSLEYV